MNASAEESAGESRGVAVVTGASTGIGRACALELDRLGFEVLAGVRMEADGERLRADAAGRLAPLIVDVANGDSIAAAATRVAEVCGERGLAGLVNNAGIVVAGPVEFISLDELRRQLEVNLVGQIAVTQALLGELRRARGRVVNMSSIGGRMAPPFVSPYAISKWGLEAFSDCLRRELRPWGIEVSVIEPGAVATPIWEKGTAAADEMLEGLPQPARELYGDALEALRATAAKQAGAGVPPEKVAKAVVNALTARRPRTRYVIGGQARVQALLARIAPDRLIDRLIAREMGL